MTRKKRAAGAVWGAVGRVGRVARAVRTAVATGAVVAATGLGAGAASAQQLATDDPVLQRIWNEGMNNSQLEPLSQVLLDEIGPRLTASPGMERAQAWAVETLEGWGIDARLEEYGTWEGWDRGVSHIDLVSPRVRSLEGRILAWSPGTGGRAVEGGVAYLPQIDSPADWRTFLGTVAGRWVMLSYPQPTCRADEQWMEFAMSGSAERMAEARSQEQRRWNRSLEATGSTDPRRRDLHTQLEEAGAAGIITSQWPGSYGTTRVFNAYNRRTPTFELGCEDYGLVHRLAANGQEPVLRLTAEAENRGEVPVFNVIGEIPGSEWPDQYVMLSAHYDSWEGGSGATDNGTGSVLMLETMRILEAAYPNPRRTILIGLWSGRGAGAQRLARVHGRSPRGRRRAPGPVEPGQRDGPHRSPLGSGPRWRHLVAGVVDGAGARRGRATRGARSAGQPGRRRIGLRVVRVLRRAGLQPRGALVGLRLAHLAHASRHVRQGRLRRSAQQRGADGLARLSLGGGPGVRGSHAAHGDHRSWRPAGKLAELPAGGAQLRDQREDVSAMSAVARMAR